MAAVDKRILIRMRKELKDLEQAPPLGVVCYPVNDNIVHLQAEISGPEDTPYYGGSFKIDIHIPDRYPFEPPRCQFLTRVYHPNIDEQGLICLDILKGQPKGTWGPSINISTMLMSLRLLLAQPNPDDPLLVDVANEFKENRELFKQKAQEFTRQYATGMQEAGTSIGIDTETRKIGLKELERVSDESDETSSISLSRSSSTSTLNPSTPLSMATPSSKTDLSAPVSVSTEKISLARPPLKKLTLSRRPTLSAAASAASAASAPFVAPQRKISIDQGADINSIKDSAAALKTPSKPIEPISVIHKPKNLLTIKPTDMSQDTSSPGDSNYPTLQDTIPASNNSLSQSPTSVSTTMTSSDNLKTVKSTKKRKYELVKGDGSTAEDSGAKSKKQSVRNKSLKHVPVEETSKYFSTTRETSPVLAKTPSSPLTSPILSSKPEPATFSTKKIVDPPSSIKSESPIPKLKKSMKKRKLQIQPSSPVTTTDPNSPELTQAATATPIAVIKADVAQIDNTDQIIQVESKGSGNNKLQKLIDNSLTSAASTKSTLSSTQVMEENVLPQETVQLVSESQPLLSDNTNAPEELTSLSPSNKDKGKSKAVNKTKMDIDAQSQETNENESLSSLNTKAKYQDHSFSFMNDLTTASVVSPVRHVPLTVAKKRSLLKKNRS